MDKEIKDTLMSAIDYMQADIQISVARLAVEPLGPAKREKEAMYQVAIRKLQKAEQWLKEQK